MMRWIAGLAAVLILPACGDGTHSKGRNSAGNPDDPGPVQAMSVRIVSPESGATAPERSTIIIEAAVSDPNASFARVDFYDDNRRIGSASSPPYTMTYGPLKGGTRLLCAVAVDFEGNLLVASPPVSVFVIKGDGDDDHGHGPEGHETK